MNKLALLLAAAALGAPALADETLHPEISPWSMGEPAKAAAFHNSVDYVGVLATKFPEAFGQEMRVRLIEDGFGFGNEVIGLRRIDGHNHIFAADSLWLWPYTPGAAHHPDGKDAWPVKLADVKVDRCDLAIDEPLAERIVEVWKQMLLRTSYAGPERYGFDGSDAHFAANLENGWMAGRVWTPERDSKPGRLETIAYDMKDYCKGKQQKDREKLEGDITELLGLLH